MKKEFDKKIIVIAVFVFLFVLVISVYVGMVLLKKNTYSSENGSESYIEEHKNDAVESRKDEKFLYRIFKSRQVDSDSHFYDFYIDEDYNVYSLENVYTLDDIKRRFPGGVNLSAIVEAMRTSEHTDVLKLNDEQKHYLADVLKNLNYTDQNSYTMYQDLFSNKSDYFVLNLTNGSSLTAEDENSDLMLVLEGLISRNSKFFDFLIRDNDVTKYIQDKDYKVLDLNSNLVKKFIGTSEENPTLLSPILDMYEKGMLTNNTIITMTLERMNRDKLFNCEDSVSGCAFQMDKFDEYAKRLFGPNVTYDTSSYEGYGNKCQIYSYDPETKNLQILSGTGCGTFEYLLLKPLYAYQKENKIVVIEKSLYFTMGECEEEPCYAKKYSLEKGLYTNLVDQFKIISSLEDNYSDEFEMYEPFYTYYAYTYTSSADGNYYFTDFAKLN